MSSGAHVIRKCKAKQSHCPDEAPNLEIDPEPRQKPRARKRGAARRSHLGVFVADQNVDTLGFGTSGKPPQRMFVASVKAGGWAESKKIMKDDEVMALDNQQVAGMTMDELKALMKKRPLEITIRFQGTDCEEVPRSKQTAVEQLHKSPQGATVWIAVVGEGIDHLGFGPSAMPPERVHLTAVEEGSWADTEGLFDGIELVSVDGMGVSEMSAKQFKKMLKKKRPLELGFQLEPQVDTGASDRPTGATQASGDSLQRMVAEIDDGIVLKCTHDEDGMVIYASLDSHDVIGHFELGDTLEASGQAEDHDGVWMVPIKPQGAVELELFEIHEASQELPTQMGERGKARRSALADDALQLMVSKVTDGVVLICSHGEDDMVIYASVDSHDVIGHFALGDKVEASSQAEYHDEVWMLPIKPRGAVELELFEIAQSGHELIFQTKAHGRVRSSQASDDALRRMIREVNEGTVLICTHEEDDMVVYASLDSHEVIGHFVLGERVEASGPPEYHDGIWMVPILPAGAVELELFVIAEGGNETSTQKNEHGKARTSTQVSDDSLQRMVGKVNDGTVLICNHDDDDMMIYASVDSHDSVGHVAWGEKLEASGRPEYHDGVWMVPIVPEGAVELELFVIAEASKQPLAQIDSHRKARTSSQMSDDGLQRMLGEIKDGTVLICNQEDHDMVVYASPGSHEGIGHFSLGQTVEASGTAKYHDKVWMVPIKPQGAVELELFEILTAGQKSHFNSEEQYPAQAHMAATKIQCVERGRQARKHTKKGPTTWLHESWIETDGPDQQVVEEIADGTLAISEDSELQQMVGEIDEGTILMCTHDEDDMLIYAALDSHEVIGHFSLGDKVKASGQAQYKDGVWMVPIKPQGAVELELFVIAQDGMELPQSSGYADDYDGEAVGPASTGCRGSHVRAKVPETKRGFFHWRGKEGEAKAQKSADIESVIVKKGEMEPEVAATKIQARVHVSQARAKAESKKRGFFHWGGRQEHGKRQEQGETAEARKGFFHLGGKKTAFAESGKAQKVSDGNSISVVSGKKQPSLLVPGSYRMTVNIFGAKSLIIGDEALGSADPYCSCRLLGKPATSFHTPVLRNTLNPKWNYTAEIQGFASQDALEFEVYDMDMDPKALSEELLGKVILPPMQFYPDGFDGELHLLDRNGIKSKQRLHVKVELQGAPVLEEPDSGEWDFVVLDPRGVQVYRTPRIDVRERLAEGPLLPGHLTAVVERRCSSEGMDFLRLAKPHGWVADVQSSTGLQARMEQVMREFGSWRYRVVRREGAAFHSRLTTNSEAATGGGLRVGSMAVVTERVKVGDVMFLKVVSKGWLFDTSQLGGRIMEGPLEEWGTRAPEGMEGEAIKRRQEELQWEMEAKVELQRRREEEERRREEVQRAQMWQWEQQRHQELLDEQRFQSELQNFRLGQTVDELQQKWDSYDQDVSDLLHESAVHRHEAARQLFKEQSEDPLSYINTVGDRSTISPARREDGHSDEQQGHSVISDPVLATRLQLTVTAVENLSSGKGMQEEPAKSDDSKRHEPDHKHRERRQKQFGSEFQTDRSQEEPGWSGLSNKLEDMDSAVDRLHWGPTVSGADTPMQRPKVGPIQTTRKDAESAAALDIPGGLMGFQVRKLAQNLAGVCAGVFYWAAEADFSGQMRLQVLELLLHHLRPCSHYDAGLTALWKDLEIEHARLTGQDCEWVSPEKVPAEWTPALVEQLPRNVHKRRPKKKKGHDSSFIFDDPVLCSLLSWKKEKHASHDDAASSDEGLPPETEPGEKDGEMEREGTDSRANLGELMIDGDFNQEYEADEADYIPESPTFGVQASRTKRMRQNLPHAKPGGYPKDRADFVRRTPSPPGARGRQRGQHAAEPEV